MTRPGRVAAVYTGHCLVWDGTGERLCPLPGRLLLHGERLVVGDRVMWRPRAESGVITAVLPRERVLLRSAPRRGRRGGAARPQVLAANVEQAVIVVALREPPPRTGLIDRMLVAAHAAGLDALLCLTKADLAPPAEAEALAAVYEPLGMPVRVVSAWRAQGLESLAQALAGRTSVLAGHSGTGKSTLLNALAGTDQRVAALDDTARGRHTTATARLIPLPGGGAVIDSPGVREFGLYGIAPHDLARHFPDFRAVAERCGFRDCLHREEPRCAVRAALEGGGLPPARYDSYRRLLDEALAGASPSPPRR